MVKNGINANAFRAKGEWKWKQDTLLEEVNNGTYFLVKSKQFSIRYQRKLTDDQVKVPQNNINSEVNVGTNEEASKELESIFGKAGVFSYPKPTSLIKFLINMTNKGKDIVILDFFAGSGTTGQAVMELNKDGGNRKFILCTDNSKDLEAIGEYLYSIKKIGIKPKKTEKKEYKKWLTEVKRLFENENFKKLINDKYEEYGIARRITYPRLKTVLTGVRQDNTKYGESFSNDNLIYYHTSFVDNDGNSDQAKYILVEKINELLCIKENIFELDKEHSNNVYYHYFDNNKHMFIYTDIYDKKIFNDFVDLINNTNGEKIVYLYSNDNSIDELISKRIKGLVKPIPSKIYEIYKEIIEDIKGDL